MMAQTVFVDLGARWVSAALVPAAPASDEPQTTVFPARIASGASTEAGSTGRVYQVAGGRVVVGGSPTAAGPFVERTGSTMPGSDPSSMEDALLALHAMTMLNAEPFGARLVLLSCDADRAERITKAMSQIAGLVHADPTRPFPESIHRLSEQDFRAVVAQGQQPNEPAPQCLVICHAAGAVIHAMGGEATPVVLPPIYKAFEAALLQAGSTKDPSLFLSITAATRSRLANESGPPHGGRDSILATAKELAEGYGAKVLPLLNSFQTTVLVGEDAPLILRVLEALRHSPLIHRQYLSGYPLYAARAYQKSGAAFDLPLGGSVANASPGDLHSRPHSRRQRAVRFSKDGSEVTLRISVSALDEHLLGVLRFFELSTARTQFEQDFLMKLIRIDKQ